MADEKGKKIDARTPPAVAERQKETAKLAKARQNRPPVNSAFNYKDEPFGAEYINFLASIVNVFRMFAVPRLIARFQAQDRVCQHGMLLLEVLFLIWCGRMGTGERGVGWGGVGLGGNRVWLLPSKPFGAQCINVPASPLNVSYVCPYHAGLPNLKAERDVWNAFLKAWCRGFE